MDAMPPNIEPVTIACVVEAASAQKVPLAALVSIMSHEHGRVGHRTPNPNGTYDYGPMQINTIWLDEIRSVANVSEGQLLNDGCVNVLIGAWILRRRLIRAKGNVWTAIGTYHSFTKHLAAGYRRRVKKAMDRLDGLQSVVRYANGR